MKGSLFPLGQPLRERRDRPGAGVAPRLHAALPAAWGGRSVLSSRAFPRPRPAGPRYLPATAVPPPLSSPVWLHYTA